MLVLEKDFKGTGSNDSLKMARMRAMRRKEGVRVGREGENVGGMGKGKKGRKGGKIEDAFEHCISSKASGSVGLF